MTYLNLEKQRAAEREVRFRKRVYPQWVELGKMKLDDAEYQIKIMEAIAADYRERAIAAKEQLL